jgi:hypothetical protein
MIDDEALIEQLTSAHRERSAHGEVRTAPAFHDLSEAARVLAFERTAVSRKLEAALDAEGLSSTARAVLSRIQTSSR